jgi:hypothetical protein
LFWSVAPELRATHAVATETGLSRSFRSSRKRPPAPGRGRFANMDK